MSRFSDSAILAKLAMKAMQSAGIPVDRVFAELGVSMSVLAQDARTPFVWQKAFWQAVEKVSGDPDIGLTLCQHTPPFRGQVLEYLYSSSETFGDGLRRSLAYQRLLSDATAAALVVTDASCYLREARDSAGHRHFAECLTGGTIRFFRDMSENSFTPTAIHFMHRDGASADVYRRVYGCPATLGCGEGRLYFNREALDHRIWHADTSLLALHEGIAKMQLEELHRQDLIAEVKRVIAGSLESGETGIEDVATRLGRTRRRLQTELTAAGTNFNEILNAYRSSLAQRLLARTGERIEEIAYLAGFAEPSAFYRAFRRWTGTTPQEFRDAAARRDKDGKGPVL